MQHFRKLLLTIKQEHLQLEPQIQTRDSQSSRQTALHLAVGTCNMELAQRLLVYGANVDARDRTGATPLHYAVACSYKAMVTLLVNWSSDLQTRDQNGKQPLHVAVENGASAIVDILVGAGADIQCADSILMVEMVESGE